MSELRHTTERHLRALASYVENLSPSLAIYYRLQPNEGRKKVPEKSNNPLENCCPYCNKPFEPGTYITRLNPKPKLTNRLRKLLHKYSEDSNKLGRFQKKLVEDYIEGKNKLVTTCLTCKKRVKHGGQTRIERRRQKEKLASLNTNSHLTEEKPVTAEQRKKERKKEKKKEKKKKRKAGLTDDVHAGLTIPDSLMPPDERLMSEDTRSAEDDCSKSVHKQPGLQTTTIIASVKETSPARKKLLQTKNKNLTAQDTEVKKKQQKHKKETDLIKDSTASKAKSLAINLEDMIAKKTKATKGHNSVMSIDGGLVSKSQKKRQLGQKLGLILKQEKSSGSGGNGARGSLTDFLSSL